MVGSEHPDVAISYNNLANVVVRQGDLTQAKEYHERALAIRQQTLGSQHRDVATSYNNVANVLRCEGDLKQARSIMSVLLLLGNNLWGLKILMSQFLMTT